MLQLLFESEFVTSRYGKVIGLSNRVLGEKQIKYAQSIGKQKTESTVSSVATAIEQT